MDSLNSSLIGCTPSHRPFIVNSSYTLGSCNPSSFSSGFEFLLKVHTPCGYTYIYIYIYIYIYLRFKGLVDDHDPTPHFALCPMGRFAQAPTSTTSPPDTFIGTHAEIQRYTNTHYTHLKSPMPTPAHTPGTGRLHSVPHFAPSETFLGARPQSFSNRRVPRATLQHRSASSKKPGLVTRES